MGKIIIFKNSNFSNISIGNIEYTFYDYINITGIKQTGVWLAEENEALSNLGSDVWVWWYAIPFNVHKLILTPNGIYNGFFVPCKSNSTVTRSGKTYWDACDGFNDRIQYDVHSQYILEVPSDCNYLLVQG